MVGLLVTILVPMILCNVFEMVLVCTSPSGESTQNQRNVEYSLLAIYVGYVDIICLYT